MVFAQNFSSTNTKENLFNLYSFMKCIGVTQLPTYVVKFTVEFSGIG